VKLVTALMGKSMMKSSKLLLSFALLSLNFKVPAGAVISIHEEIKDSQKPSTKCLDKKIKQYFSKPQKSNKRQYGR
jgi:hypothetical protein